MNIPSSYFLKGSVLLLGKTPAKRPYSVGLPSLYLELVPCTIQSLGFHCSVNYFLKEESNKRTGSALLSSVYSNSPQ